jgi:bifunctional non-homologous end joining protein LigD
MRIVKTASLEFREGSSDKEYHLSLEENQVNGTHSVVASWGRRGQTLQTGAKASGVSLEEAEKIYDKTLKEKTGKGYKPMGGESSDSPAAAKGVTSSVVLPTDQRDTGLRPQLLNPIDEEEAEAYLTDDDWVGQEKFDGKRMTIRKDGNVTYAANKKGLSIGFPDAIAAAVSHFMSSFVGDGEAVGERLHAFDLLELNGTDLRELTYAERLEHLKGMLGTAGEAVRVAETAVGARAKRALMAKLKAAGKEGIVFKRLSSKWYAGRPASGGAAVKCKFYKTASVIVLKVNAKRSIAVGVLDGETVVPVGNVTVAPNKDVPPMNALVEVRYLYAYKGGSLYQPTYLQDRSDELNREECVIGQLGYKAENED